jgi:hypothetical protein
MADSTDTAEDYPSTPAELGKYWHEQLDHSKTVFSDWQTRGERVVDRYRDERGATGKLKTKFNILWSNVEVLTPSLYGRAAKPEVSRRYMDQDPIGRLASTMLERVLEYECEQFPDYDSAMRSCVEDRLLPGRGTAWVRYDPIITQEKLEAPKGEAEITNTEPIVTERIDAAHSPVDYIFWKDFRHSPARIWDEVWWAARRVYMTRKEGKDRFGKIFTNVPLSASDTEDSGKKNPKTKSTISKKAEVWEVWDKRAGKVCWVARDYPEALDERDDPLSLEGFFPCPRPLYATMTNGSLLPVPDYIEYEDQARELDSITGRISNLIRAVKAVGVYNQEFKELARLLSEGVDNMLFGVVNWAALAEKGGLKGAVDMLDITVITQALGVLYKAREDVKQTIYEICGISDILRGATNAQETLGAQQLKANFGSLRLKSSQTDVARFASDLFRLKAEIICKFYPPQLIVQMSGIQQTDDGRDPKMLRQALQMLSNSTIREFHISVESDTLAQIDDQAEKQAANDAITAISNFMAKAGPMIEKAPETLPMASEMLLFLVRRYRAGRGLESAIERGMKALEQKAMAAQQQPQPNPEMIKAQAQIQASQNQAQVDMQTANAKAQLDAQVQQAKQQQDMQLEREKAALDAQAAQRDTQFKGMLATMEQQFEAWKAKLESETKIRIAEITAKAGVDAAKENVAEASISP